MPGHGKSISLSDNPQPQKPFRQHSVSSARAPE